MLHSKRIASARSKEDLGWPEIKIMIINKLIRKRKATRWTVRAQRTMKVRVRAWRKTGVNRALEVKASGTTAAGTQRSKSPVTACCPGCIITSWIHLPSQSPRDKGWLARLGHMFRPGFSRRASRRSGPFGFCPRKQAPTSVRRAHSKADSLNGNLGAWRRRTRS